MPDSDARTVGWRGITQMIASSLYRDHIILVIQAECSAPLQISKIFMREHIAKSGWKIKSEVPEMASGFWLVVDQNNFTARSQMFLRRRESRDTCAYDEGIHITIGLVVASFVSGLRERADSTQTACSQPVSNFDDCSG